MAFYEPGFKDVTTRLNDLKTWTYHKLALSELDLILRERGSYMSVVLQLSSTRHE